jgi:hypothetical protein
VKYACIEEHRQEFEVRLMCRVLGVSRSGFYAWKQNGPSQRARQDERLRTLIRIVHRTSRRRYQPVAKVAGRAHRLHFRVSDPGSVILSTGNLTSGVANPLGTGVLRWRWERAKGRSGRRSCGSPRTRSSRHRAMPSTTGSIRCCARTASMRAWNTSAVASTAAHWGVRACRPGRISGCC